MRTDREYEDIIADLSFIILGLGVLSALLFVGLVFAIISR